jgi:hypothetical protein
MNQSIQVMNEPKSLFYVGSKILLKEIIRLKGLLIKLENEQFNYNTILDNTSSLRLILKPKILLMSYGILFGLFFRL